MVRQYEAMYVVTPQADEDHLNAFVTKVEETIKKAGGQVERVDRQGRKRMAYTVGKFNDGHYFLTHFAAPSNGIHELDRLFNLSENIIRHMIVRKEA